jgi:hypothetical protein
LGRWWDFSELVAPAKPIQFPPRAALGRFIQPRISGELK